CTIFIFHIFLDPSLSPKIKPMDIQADQIKDQITPTNLENLQQQLEDAQNRNIEFALVIEELSIERDCLKRQIFAVEGKVREREEELLRRIDDGVREKEFLEVEIYEGVREREELVKKIDVGVVGLIKECLMRVNEVFDELEYMSNFEENLKGLLNFEEKLKFVLEMAKRAEDKMNVHLENVKKEKRELERSVMSLTEENRDVNALLRIALVEKEAVEKSLSKLRGNYEQRRVPLLQFAERGLQRVGFGFMIGGSSNDQYEDQKKHADQTSDHMTSNSSVLSDVSSECEEEAAVSLASTVEKMMKNLRLEIIQLKGDLEDSRSDTERLLSLTEKQAQQISEQTVYVKELEDREKILTQNVEELVDEIKATEEEVERWKEACELEVEAGKHVAQEHNKLVSILKQELEKTRTALQVSNKKLQLKEEVAAAAMAAQSAAERSLQLADSRAVGLRERIEELTRQVEEIDNSQKKNRRRMRRICWPWQALNPANAASSRVQDLDIRHMLPEMQAFIN
ncbi:uncharacterized protein At3g49055, partial [Beta vulgaris subsp. vulgaris]|uniref:uncharacterized protein At3g49055 n=1 Tax=Beta vulgaris subsp. vulgaris TaxID=3555 RepID=UPI00254920E1